MPYNKSLEVPRLQKEPDGSCTYTHNHASGYTFKYTKDRLTLQTRKEARAFMDQGKSEINRCILFAKTCSKDNELTGIQKATLEHSIKSDEDLIQLLNDAKPSRCAIS